VDVDVVEDREAEGVGTTGGILTFIEHDADARDGLTGDVFESEAIAVKRKERDGPTPAESEPSGPRREGVSRGRVAAEEVAVSIRGPDVEAGSTGAAVRAPRIGRHARLADVIPEFGKRYPFHALQVSS